MAGVTLHCLIRFLRVARVFHEGLVGIAVRNTLEWACTQVMRALALHHCYTCPPEGHKMNRRIFALLFAFSAGAIIGHVAIPLLGEHFAQPDVVMAQAHKPVMITRLYTGPDNQTHAEEVELKFTPGNPAEVSKMMPITSAELHRTAGGSVDDWHRAPRRQYVITLSGRGEVEVAGGKNISLGPGSIDLVEDTTGKGHITKVVSTEDRVTLQLPLLDQPGR